MRTAQARLSSPRLQLSRTVPGHRANILGDFNYIGLGVVQDGGLLWVTEVFMRGPPGLVPAPAPGATAPVAGAAHGDTVMFVDAAARFHLYSAPTAAASVATFFYGNPGDVPLSGDWDCNGSKTPGMVRVADGFVYLKNSNTQGVADASLHVGSYKAALRTSRVH